MTKTKDDYWTLQFYTCDGLGCDKHADVIHAPHGDIYGTLCLEHYNELPEGKK